VQDSTRRQITWVIVAGLVVILIIFIAYRRTAVERALNNMATGQPAQQVAAAAGLIREGRLATAVEGEPRWVQDRAVAAALRVGSPKAFGQLLKMAPLVDKPVAEEIKASLAMVGARAVGAAAQELSNQNAKIRAAASSVLASIGVPSAPSLLPNIGVYNDDTRAAVTAALIGIGEAVIPSLIEILQQTSPGLEQSAGEFVRSQDAACEALTAMNVKSLAPAVDQLLTSEHAAVRETGMRLIGAIIGQAPESFERLGSTGRMPLAAHLASDPDWRVRRQAALSLGQLLSAGQQPRVVNALVEALGDSRAEVKAAAATALGQIGATEVAPILVRTLMTNRVGATAELQLALRRLGTPVIPALSPALNSDDPETRRLATEILAGIGSSQVVAPLAARLADSSPAIRRLAAETLGSMPQGMLTAATTSEVVDQMLAALGDPNWHVYHAVRDALALIGRPAVPALIDKLSAGDLRSKYMAQQALVDIRTPAIQSLLNALSSPVADVRHWVAMTLGKIGPAIIDPISGLVNDSAQPAETRAAAIRAVGYTKSPAATDLLKAVEASTPQVRIAVLRAVSDIRDPAATELLVSGLSDSSPKVREVAYALLRDWQLGEVTKCLQQVLEQGDENARRRAAVILAYHTSPEANRLLADVLGGVAYAEENQATVEVLTETIQDTGEELALRREAVKNLGSVATLSSVSVLKDLLTPEGPFVSEAAQSMAQIGVRTAAGAKQEAGMSGVATQLITVLKETKNEELRAQVAGALATMKELPVAALIDGLRTYPDEVKPWAAAILAAIGEPAAEPLLSARTKSKDGEQRLWCVAALDAVGSKLATRLLNYLPDEEKPDQSWIDQVHKIKTRILSRK